MPIFDRHITEGLTLHQRLQNGSVRTYYKLAKKCHVCGKVLAEEEGDCLCFSTLAAMERAKEMVIYCRPECWWKAQTDEERARQREVFLDEVEAGLTPWEPDHIFQDDDDLLDAIYEWLAESWGNVDEPLSDLVGCDVDCPLEDGDE